MSQPRIFVSHSHQDDAFTLRLVADLKRAGAAVWVDVVNVGAGDFLDRINEALDACEWVVLVLTSHALSSPWVKQEINAAIRLKHQSRIRDIIPIQVGHVEKIPPLWGVFNIFDATTDYAAARDAILRVTGLPIQRPAPLPLPALLKGMGEGHGGRGRKVSPAPGPTPKVTATDRLGNVLEVIELGRRTGLLSVERNTGSGVEEGEIYYAGGHATYAICGYLRGRDALRVLAAWQECRFSFSPSVSPPAPNID